MLDFGGAKGSNTGDAFHELWAVRQAIRLLEPDSMLESITLEGLRTEDEVGVEGTRWLGVDCGLYYRSETDGSSLCLDAQQLKYSGADSQRAWTVARMASGKGPRSKGAGSVIRRLADVYRGWVLDSKNGAATLTVSLVTNQPIADDLKKAIAKARNGVPKEYSKRLDADPTPLHRLVKASGLTPAQFTSFAARLELSGSADSRFKLEDQIIQAVIGWTEADSFEVAERLRRFVRDRMLPESSREPITSDRVLGQFQAHTHQTLFPCPADIRQIKAAVPRAIVDEVAKELIAGQQRICLHGGGGVGKTTALQQLAANLPPESLTIIFDCYGGGSYLDAEGLRHRPADAFLQLINETAVALRLPLLTPAGHFRDPVRTFHRRLSAAATTLAVAAPGAILLLVIDAADNSIAAASGRSPPEVSFVHDFAAVGAIPPNVRFVITARTARLPTLNLPSTFKPIPLMGFCREETEANVSRAFPAPAEWIDDFHALSGGNPRVQSYAFASAPDEPVRAIDALRPAGKDLETIFRSRFEFALKKGGGNATDIRALCAALIALPRPVPLDALSGVTQLPSDRLADIVQDLAPGLRLDTGHVGFADEDFEAFVREAGEAALDSIKDRAADWLLARAGVDAYAGLHVATALLQAGRRGDLLSFVETQPEPPASLFPDPVRRAEAHSRRLLVATKACREAGEPGRAIKFVLQGAEAARRDAAVRDLLADNPELAARFARNTAGRLVLGDPDAQHKWGALILQIAAEDARSGDFVAVRDGRRRFGSWQTTRWDKYQNEKARWGHAKPWEIAESDYEAFAYTIALEKGGEAAARWLRGTKTSRYGWPASVDLVDRLLAEGRRDIVREMAAAIPKILWTFILVPLSCSGDTIDFDALLDSLRRLRRSKFLDFSAYASSRPYGETSISRFFDTYLAGCELLASQEGKSAQILILLQPFLQPEFRWSDKRYVFEVPLIDFVVRAATLRAAIAREALYPKNVFPSRSADEDPDPGQRQGSRRDRDNVELQEFVRPVVAFHAARANALHNPAAYSDLAVHLESARKNLEDSWRFSREHQTYQLRSRLSTGITVFSGIGYEPAVVLKLAIDIRKGWGRDYEGATLMLVRRLSAHESLHADLIHGLTSAAEALRVARVGAQERMDDLVAYATLLAAFSRHDASVVFEAAVGVAGELDAEVYDQLRVIAALAERAGDTVPAVASDLAEIAYDAGVRLSGHKAWGWRPAMRALARIDLSFALACVSRWDDTKVAPRGETLEPVIAVGLGMRRISPGDAVALIVLQGDVGDATVHALKDASGSDWPQICEALAHHALRGSVVLNRSILAAIAPQEPNSGSATGDLLAHEAFAEINRAADESERQFVRPDKEGAPDLRAAPEAFQVADVLDGTRLGAAIEERFAAARTSKQHVGFDELAALAREAVPVARRVDHLEALRTLPLDPLVDQRIDAIIDAIQAWPESAPVKVWARKNLAGLVKEHFGRVARFAGFERNAHQRTLELCELSDVEMLNLLLEGIEVHGEAHGSAWTFGIATDAAMRLEPADAASLLNWYVARLSGRLPAEARECVASEALAPAGAVARSLYAALGDVDQRVRWRAAHSLRQLVALGAAPAVDLVIGEYGRTSDALFRSPAAPFYGLAARLWLLVALDRIAAQHPSAIVGHFAWLVGVATDATLPHIVARAFARDAALKLLAAGVVMTDQATRDALAAVNRSPLPLGPKRRFGGDIRRAKMGRYHFDSLDMLPGLYEPALRGFSDLTDTQLLETAERWIVDVWGAHVGAGGWSEEPRKNKFDNDDYGLTSTRGGALPVLERYRSYLEWHALWCAVGELINTHALTEEEVTGDWGSMAYMISREQLTAPPYWLADLVTPTPLTPSIWVGPVGAVDPWLEAVGEEELRAELLPPDRPGYVAVHVSSRVRRSGSRQEVDVSTALMSRDTGAALLSALQSTEYSEETYLPPEGNEIEIDEGPYRLSGWLIAPSGDVLFDDNDDSRNDVSNFARIPGVQVGAWGQLSRELTERGVAWLVDGDPDPIFIYEAWGGRMKRGRDADRVSSQSPPEGARLLMRSSALQGFLESTGMDLVAEVRIERANRGSRTDSEEGTEVAHERFYGLAADGALSHARGCLEPWTTDSL